VKPYWNSRIRSLSPYVPGEQPRDGRFIKLNTNENPYPPSPAVIAAIRRAADERLRLYPDPLCTEFREAAAARYGVRPGQVFPGNGSDEVLAFAFGAFFESPGAAGTLPVLFPDISYSFYPVYAALWNIPYKNPPLTEDFSIRPEDYYVPSGGVILPNPNAPTGRSLSAEAVLGMVRARNERLVIIDEAYAAFGAESVVPFVDSCPNLLTVHTLSKAASLAGLRVGFAIGNEDLIQGLCRIRDSFNSYTLDALALAGAAAALSDFSYYDGVNRRISATRERVSAALSALGFEVIPSRANFVFIRHPRRGGGELAAALRERGILVRRFDKPRIADYLRVSMGTDADMDVFLKVCGEVGV
jgi:histidinol-phosphate aminotransferase